MTENEEKCTCTCANHEYNKIDTPDYATGTNEPADYFMSGFTGASQYAQLGRYPKRLTED